MDEKRKVKTCAKMDPTLCAQVLLMFQNVAWEYIVYHMLLL